MNNGEVGEWANLQICKLANLQVGRRRSGDFQIGRVTEGYFDDEVCHVS